MPTTQSDTDWLRIALVVLAAVVLLPLVSMAVMMPMMGIGMWGRQGGTMGGGYAPLWGVGTSLVWVLVLVGVGYLLYRGVAGSDAFGRRDPAIEELRVAYARGDLTEEEFETRRDRLRREE